MPNDGPIISPDFIDAHTHSRSGDSKSPTSPGKLAPSNGMNLDPRYLLQHENKFDPNVYTPEQMWQKHQQGSPIQTT